MIYSCYSTALFKFHVISTRVKHWKYRTGWNHFGSLFQAQFDLTLAALVKKRKEAARGVRFKSSCSDIATVAEPFGAAQRKRKTATRDVEMLVEIPGHETDHLSVSQMLAFYCIL